MGDAMRKRICLAGPRAGDDQEGSADVTVGGDAVLNGATLLGIERFEIGCCRRREHRCPPGRTLRSMILVGTAMR